MVRRLSLFALLLVSAWLSLVPKTAFAADPCPLLRAQTASPDLPTRIAAFACKENQDWYRPFIDADGRVSGTPVYEAENSRLADGNEAWRKVAHYWIESGLLGSAMGRNGASDCAYAGATPGVSPGCRGFVIDTPWSAAFVSWVMREAGVPGFRYASSHVDYTRAAYREPAQSPYYVQAPQGGRPAPGDLLCSVRMASRIFGFGELATLLSLPEGSGLAMHCDIVVGSSDGIAYLVGGNVQQAVTLRMLRLDANGGLSNLQQRTLADAECSPDAVEACNANRLDWAVLLKLKPAEQLAQLPPAPAPVSAWGLPAPATPAATTTAQHCRDVGGGQQVCTTAGNSPNSGDSGENAQPPTSPPTTPP